jgi:putative membrane protein
MIVKRNFDPVRVWAYVRTEVTAAAVLSAGVVAAVETAGVDELAIPFATLVVLGTALAIFLAFRNNTSYARWWEARQLWSGIVASSRTFARLVVTFVDAHRETPEHDPETAAEFKREMVLRQIAWAHALRLTLRGQDTWAELETFLPDGEMAILLQAANRPNVLLGRQGRRIYEAMSNGTLQGFDSFQLEQALAQLAGFQAGCERIKETPLLRQYDYFTRLFLWVFVLLSPFALVGDTGWAAVPLATLLAFVFTTIAKVGAVNEDPFEQRIQDVPLSAICRSLERDLLEQLGERRLPAPIEPVGGYLD